MVWWLVGAAQAQDSVVAIKVTGPDGNVAMQDELVLPADRVLPAPDGKHSLGVYTSVFDGHRAVIELAAGPTKDGRPKTKVAMSVELDAWVPRTEQLLYKKSTWTVEVQLGHVWDAPAPVATDETNRFVLVWDDAPMVADPEDLKTPPVVERPLPEGRTDALVQSSPMRIVDTYGDTHLELETVPTPGPAHCQSGGPPLEPQPMQHYVRLKDLVPRVTAREVTAKLPDGTGYRVAAGVPVVAEGEGTWRIQTGGLSFLIRATAEDLAFYYRPSAHFPVSPAQKVHVAPGVVGRTALGDVSWAGAEPLPVVGMRGAASPLATFQVPCAEVRVKPDTASFLP